MAYTENARIVFFFRFLSCRNQYGGVASGQLANSGWQHAFHIQHWKWHPSRWYDQILKGLLPEASHSIREEHSHCHSARPRTLPRSSFASLSPLQHGEWWCPRIPNGASRKCICVLTNYLSSPTRVFRISDECMSDHQFLLFSISRHRRLFRLTGEFL